MRCELCNSEVKIVGNVTKHYEPAEDEIKEAFLGLLGQACGSKDGYDSMCISSYEHALDLAVGLGWIEKKEVIR